MPPQSPAPLREQAAAFFQKHRTGLITLVFTDLADSTAILSQLGDQSGATFMQRRRQVIRETLRLIPEGEEIETAGDSFLLAFAKPSDAVRFALQGQARLRAFSGQSGLPIQERMGIHLGEVVISEHETPVKVKDFYGIQLATCARVLSLALGGQILLTRGVFDSARQVLKGEDLCGVGPLSWLSHGPYQLKGIEELVEVCEVGEVGASPLAEPKTSEKARRYESAETESVLGWRPAVGQEVPNTKWLLEKKLGEGGFGEVWLGRHQTMKERRVFKFCFRTERVRSLKREMTLFRVLKERIGDHPNIVRLLEVNFEEAPFYIVMDHVEGQDLRAWCELQGGAASVLLTNRLEIVAQIADALQAAHDAGVIHRDVKPGNILVSGVLAEPAPRAQAASLGASLGRPQLRAKLTDFGIGHVVSEEALQGVTKAGFTQTLVAEASSQTGSQLYMAPELLAGKPASIRSDIYSLGVVLYQLLAGDLTRPLTTDWSEHISDPLLRDDLKHCFSGNPQDRFAGAEQLAKNLRGLPQRQAELARKQAELAAREKAAYRRGVLRTAALAAVIVIALGALSAVAWTQSRIATTTARELRVNSYAADMKVVHVALLENNRKRAGELLRKYTPKQGERTGLRHDDLRGLEWRYLWSQAQGEEIDTLHRFPGPAKDAVFSPTDPNLVATLSQAGEIKILELGTQRTALALAGEFVPLGSAGRYGFSPDGRSFAAIRRGNITLWDTDSWLERREQLDLGGVGESLVYSPDGRIVAACVPGGVGLWDIATGQTNFLETGIPEAWRSTAISADGLFLAAAGCFSRSIQLWDLASLSRLDDLTDAGGCVVSLAFSPKTNLLAAGNWDGMLKILDFTTKGLLVTHETGPSFILGIAFSPNGRTLALACGDHTIRLLDVASQQPVATLHGHLAEVWKVMYSPDGQYLVSASKDGTVKLWKATSEQRREHSWEELSGQPSAHLFQGSGMLASWRNERVQFWKLVAGKATRTFTSNITRDELDRLCLSSDGKLAAVGKTNGVVEFYDCATGQLTTTLKAGEDLVVPQVISPDKKRIVLRRPNDSGLNLWNIQSHTRGIGLPEAEVGYPVGISFSPDGRLLAYVATQYTIKLWDLLAMKESFTLRGHTWPVHCVNFSPDGKILLSTSVDDDVRLWDARTGQPFGQPLRGHTQGLRWGQFSPDGRTVLTTDQISVRFWNVSSGQEMVCHRDAGDFLLAPDGNTLALRHVDGKLRLVPIPTLAEIDAKERRAAKSP